MILHRYICPAITAVAKNSIFSKSNQINKPYASSVNHITRPNLLQHLKVIQRSTAFYSTIIHLLAKFLLTMALQDLELAPTIQYGRLSRHQRYWWVANPGYEKYTIYGHTIDEYLVTIFFVNNDIINKLIF